MRRPEQILSQLLVEKKLTVAFAESVTCGLVAHTLANVPGTSDFLIGSLVCYNEKVKTSLLNVKPVLIRKFTAESQEVTDVLAKNLKSIFSADIYAAVTGLASSGGSESPGKPVGSIFITVIIGKRSFRKKSGLSGSPLTIRKKACDQVLSFITQKLKNISHKK